MRRQNVLLNLGYQPNCKRLLDIKLNPSDETELFASNIHSNFLHLVLEL